MHSPYTANTFAHFVGRAHPHDHDANFETLGKVLTSRCVSYGPPVAGGSKTSYTIDPKKPLHTEELIVPTVTCYADIPEASFGIHVKKYGFFGVGFDRNFIIKAGARPVTYVPMFANEWMHAINGRYLLEDIAATYLGFREFCEERLGEKRGAVTRTMKTKPVGEANVLHAIKSLLEKDFLAYLKPFNSELPVGDPNNFYMEREWRKYGYLDFTEDDVARVWVADGYGKQVAERFPALAGKLTELTR